MLSAYLKINGVDAKEHAVYQELRRVQTYFAKVKEAEESVLKPSMTLNKQAAARMIQHSLVGEKGRIEPTSNVLKAGNGQSDMTQREKELKERILAQRKKRMSDTVKALPQSTPQNGLQIQEAESMLASLAREIAADRAEDAEGSEEGEIDESSNTPVAPIQHPLPLKPQFDTPPQAPMDRKRKQNQVSPNKQSADKKAEKRARKKAKKSQAANAIAAVG